MDRWRSLEPHRPPKAPRTPEDVITEAKARFEPQRGRECWEEYAEHSLTHDDVPRHANGTACLDPEACDDLINYFARAKGELCSSK